MRGASSPSHKIFMAAALLLREPRLHAQFERGKSGDGPNWVKSFIPSPHSTNCTYTCCSCVITRGTHLDLMRRSIAAKKDKRSATAVSVVAAASTSAAAGCVHTHPSSSAKKVHKDRQTARQRWSPFFVCPARVGGLSAGRKEAGLGPGTTTLS